MESVRIGIVGMGNMGSSHARYLRQGDISRCTLTAVCDTISERIEPFRNTDIKTYTDSKELIRSGEVDAVLIATPHYDHTTIGIDAFEQGLHVLVEKPISVHKADCERLISAYEAAGDRIFGAMFQMRTEPVYQRIKALIDNGELGDIQRTSWIVTSWFRSNIYYASGGCRATWKGEGGGVLLNQCPHNLDLFQWFCGMPTKVRAFCGFGKYHPIEVEDEVTAYFEYPNGATGTFVTSTGEAPGSDRLEIAGDRGRLLYENGKLTFIRNEIRTSDYTKTTTEPFGRPPVWHVDIPITGPRGGHAVITQNFVDAILDGKPVLAPAVEGIHSIEIANAMLYSAITDTTVELPLDGVAYEAHLKKLIAESTFKKDTVDAPGPSSDMAKSFR